MDIALVEFEEAAEGFNAALLFVELHAAGLVIRQFRERPKNVED
jgi:hypothetical protein